MVAAAVIGGAVISAGAGMLGSSSAASAQTASADKASETQLKMYNQTRADLSPYNTFGQSSLGQMKNLLGLGANGTAGIQQTLNAMPGYQYTLNTGLQSVQNSAAARGLGVSGAALKGAADYSTNLAQSNYGNYYNQLMGASQLGENAAAQTGAYGTQTAGNIGNNLIGAGNAQGAADIAGANSVGNAANSIGQYYMLQGLYGSGGSGASSGGASGGLFGGF